MRTAIYMVIGTLALGCGDVAYIGISAETYPGDNQGGPVPVDGVALPGVWTQSGGEGGLAYRAKFVAHSDGAAYHFSMPLPHGARIDRTSLRVRSRGDGAFTEPAMLVFVRIENATGEVGEVGHMTDPGGTEPHDIVVPANGETIDLHLYNYRLDFVAQTGGDTLDVISPPMVVLSP